VPPRSDVTVSQDAMRLLMAYEWPGNVRQLENVLERALALSPGRSQIEVSALPPDIQHSETSAPPWVGVLPDEGVDLARVVTDTERALIARALDRTGGNRHQAARLLGIKRTTLVQKIKRLDLTTTPETDAVQERP
jgi:two-component system response regulator AtoC